MKCRHYENPVPTKTNLQRSERAVKVANSKRILIDGCSEQITYSTSGLQSTSKWSSVNASLYSYKIEHNVELVVWNIEFKARRARVEFITFPGQVKVKPLFPIQYASRTRWNYDDGLYLAIPLF